MIITLLAIIGALTIWALTGHIGYWVLSGGFEYKNEEDYLFPTILAPIVLLFGFFAVIARAIENGRSLRNLRKDVDKIKKKLKIK